MQGSAPSEVFAALRARYGNAFLVSLLKKYLYPQQLAVLDDDAMKVAVCCSRRTGKSVMLIVIMLIACLSRDNVRCAYVGDTFGRAKRIVWHDILLMINNKLQLGGIPNESLASVRFPNGSSILIVGAASTQEAHERLKGQHFDVVGIDEAQDFDIDLKALCNDTIVPMLADTKGRLLMCGTPDNVRRYFYDVTASASEGNKRPVPGWSVHRWTALDNPHIDFQGHIDAVLASDPSLVNSPGFRQHYYGEWQFDEELLCFPGFSERAIAAAPELGPGDYWDYVLGLDLGFNDSTSLVALGYAQKVKRAHVFACWKQSGAVIADINNEVRRIRGLWDIDRYVADTGGGGKLTVESMKQMTNVNWVAAGKIGVEESIGLVNDDLRSGTLTIDPSCAELIKELRELSWDKKLIEKDGTRKVAQGSEDHAIDALRYAWLLCFHHVADVEEPIDIETVPIHLRPQVPGSPTENKSLIEAIRKYDEANRKGRGGWSWPG